MRDDRIVIEKPDDETIEIYVAGELVASANHDEHGWSGMDAVEATALAVARALPGPEPHEDPRRLRQQLAEAHADCARYATERDELRDVVAAWRRWVTGSLVRMQDLDDTEQALLDALALGRCGQCHRCADCRQDAPFAASEADRG